MKFTLEIACDNGAFKSPDDESEDRFWTALETASIMAKVAAHLQMGETEGKAVDSNGNVVGHWSVA